MCCKKVFNTNKDEIKQTHTPLTATVIDHIMWQAFSNNLEQNHILHQTIKNLNRMENR